MDLSDIFAVGINRIFDSSNVNCNSETRKFSVSVKPGFDCVVGDVVLNGEAEVLSCILDEDVISIVTFKEPLKLTGRHSFGAEILCQMGYDPYTFYTFYPDMAKEIDKYMDVKTKVKLFARLDDILETLGITNANLPFTIMREKGILVLDSRVQIAQALRLVDDNNNVVAWVVSEFVHYL